MSKNRNNLFLAKKITARVNPTRVTLLVSKCLDHHTKQGNLGFRFGTFHAIGTIEASTSWRLTYCAKKPGLRQCFLFSRIIG